jgi:hypothetical protein
MFQGKKKLTIFILANRDGSGTGSEEGWSGETVLLEFRKIV